MYRAGMVNKLALWAAVVGGVVAASFCVLTVADKYGSAQQQLETCKKDLEGWEACRATRPAYYQENIAAVTKCLAGLSEAQEDFWAKISFVQFVGLCICAVVLGAAVGALSVWLFLRGAVRLALGLGRSIVRARQLPQGDLPH